MGQLEINVQSLDERVDIVEVEVTDNEDDIQGNILIYCVWERTQLELFIGSCVVTYAIMFWHLSLIFHFDNSTREKIQDKITSSYC